MTNQKSSTYQQGVRVCCGSYVDMIQNQNTIAQIVDVFYFDTFDFLHYDINQTCLNDIFPIRTYMLSDLKIV